MIKHKKIKSILLSIFLVLSIVCFSLFPFSSKLSIDDENQRFITPKVAESTPYIAWIANGTPISTANDSQGRPQLISDGAGGAIIAWTDARNSTNTDIYAQRINSAGVVQWATNGIPICTADYSQNSPQLISDGAGGAIIIWMDDRDIEGIYAQRINSSGDVQWSLDGIPITTTLIAMIPQIIGDGAGGAIIAWADFRDSTTDIYAQKINSSGDVQWAINGIPICTANYGHGNPRLASDGTGGAIITWADIRNSTTTNNDIYAQRINSAGVVQWTTNGIPICTANNIQWRPQIISDGVGGAIIAWRDFRISPTHTESDIYAQRINSSGNAQWTTNGTAVSTAVENQESISLVSDSLEGAFIGWMDSRNAGGSYIHDIYIQKLNSTGHPQWIENGIPVCTIDDMQLAPELISDGLERVIVIWEDHRVSGYQNADIYAQKVIHNTIPTSNHPGFINTTTAETETIDWVLKDDGPGGNYRVLINSTVYQDWQSWVSDTPLNVSIDHSVAGIFNYIIEYYDNYDKYGVPDSVIVSILNTSTTPGDLTEGDSKNNNPSISFGYSFIFPMIFGMVLLTYVARRKYVLQKKSSKNG